MSRFASSLWLRALFAAAAFVIAMASSRHIFHGMPVTSDENSYVFQAYNFRDGVIARPAPPAPEAFEHDMIVLDQQRGWFSRYSPGHSLWLLPGTFFDAIHPMIGLAAAVAIWFACAAAAALGIAQAFVALTLLASPFFVFMYGTHLSHTSGLAVCALLCWAYILGQRDQRRWAMIFAGLAWSLLFLNRTYTALLIALPFGIDACWSWLRARTVRQFMLIALFAAGASVGVLAYLAYNKLATGNAFQATYLFYEPSEGLGFGPRRTQGLKVLHTPERGFDFMVDNVLALNTWLLGFTGSLLAAAALVLLGWSRRWSALLLGAVVSVWLGYIAFWYKGIPDVGGPVYYFETLIPLFLLAGLGLQRLWAFTVGRPRLRAVASLLLVAALGATSWTFCLREAKDRAPLQEFRRKIARVVAQLPSNAIVFFEKYEVPKLNELAFNPRGLDSRPLRLQSQYEDNRGIQRLFHGRPAYLLHASDPLAPILLPDPAHIEFQRRASKFHRRTGREIDLEDGQRVRVVEAARDAANWLAFGLHINVPAGRYRVRWLGDARNIDPAKPLLVDITTQRGKIMLTQTNVHGTHMPMIVELDLVLTNAMTPVEPRLRYGGSGDLLIREVRIEESP